MDKKERVLRCLQGKDIDRIPYSFSKHFPADFAYGQIGIDKHVEMYNESGVDIVKIMNEHLMPYIGHIAEPKDWLKVRKLTADADFIVLFVDFVKRLYETLGQDHYYMLTVHGLIACTIHISLRQYGFYDARRVHAEHCR